MSHVVIQELIGKEFSSVKVDEETLYLRRQDGHGFRICHMQDCCEHAYIADIEGDVSVLQGSPILIAEESSGSMGPEVESGTWTFYRFATLKGWITMRWEVVSNGYYGESVNIYTL